MKRIIKKVFILFIIMLVLSISVILIMGNTQTIVFDINNQDSFNVEVEKNDNIVDILDEYRDNDKYIIKVKAKQKGICAFLFENNDIYQRVPLYVHNNLVITKNSFFGYSRGSEIIPVSMSIILVYSLVLLIKEYKKSIKENLYQYKNIAYLGIIIFISMFTFFNILSIFNYYGIDDTIDKMINSTTMFSIIILPIAFITFILVTISNIVLIKKEGMSYKNLLGLFLGVFICVLTILPEITYNYILRSQSIDIFNLNSVVTYIYDYLESLIYLIVAYLECVLLATIIIAIKSARKKLEYNKDYIIILGCQIRKDGTLTPLLKARVDKALSFREEQLKMTNKDLVFITSGGKGDDESISEAEAMKNYLLKNGIKENNILMDDKSKDTYQNLKFSHKLITKKNANVAFSTTNYHVLRAGLLATEQNFLVEGMGSKTKAYFYINAFIREFIGTLYHEKKKHIILFLLLLVSLAIMIIITYFSNNI